MVDTVFWTIETFRGGQLWVVHRLTAGDGYDGETDIRGACREAEVENGADSVTIIRGATR